MRNRGPRALLALVVLAFLLSLPSFVRHLTYFLSGQIGGAIVTGNWAFVAINVAVFLAVAGFLRVRESIDWSQKEGLGLYAAFIVSLFVEMYGIPLSIYLGQGVISGPPNPPNEVVRFTVLGQGLSMNWWMIVGAAITAFGMVLIAVGWYQIYTADGLRTDGLYAYSRNPQYLGIVLIAFGWVIGFPTLLTIAIFPLLVVAYYRVAKREAADLEERYGEAYERYRERVPLVI